MNKLFVFFETVKKINHNLYKIILQNIPWNQLFVLVPAGLHPPSLDELVEENNIARAIEEYVEVLNIHTKKSLVADRQPAFHQKLLLKYTHLWIPKQNKK